MTSNQLQYWRNVETERTNRANEAIKQQEAESKQLSAQASMKSAEAAKAKADSDVEWRPYEVDNAHRSSWGTVAGGIGKIIGALNPLKFFG